MRSAIPRPASGSGFSLRFALGSTAILAAQIAILWLFHRPVPAAKNPGDGLTVRVLADPRLEKSVLAQLDDPALLASPNGTDLSRRAWMKPSPLPHSFNDWSAPQRWLSPGQADRARSEPQPIPPTVGPGSIGLSTPIQTPDALPAPVLRTEKPTTFEIGGELRRRRILKNPALPTLTTTNLHPPTILNLTVDGLGFVVGARTTANPATMSPDQSQVEFQAIQLTRDLLFEPLPGKRKESLSFGTLKIHWGTRPQTNAAPTQASPQK